VEAKLAASGKDAKRLIAENGALIDGVPVSKDFPFVNVERMRDFTKVSAGKKRHALVRLAQGA
jgi:tyrosyl-tRNA synthetase